MFSFQIFYCHIALFFIHSFSIFYLLTNFQSSYISLTNYELTLLILRLRHHLFWVHLIFKKNIFLSKLELCLSCIFFIFLIISNAELTNFFVLSFLRFIFLNYCWVKIVLFSYWSDQIIKFLFKWSFKV